MSGFAITRFNYVTLSAVISICVHNMNMIDPFSVLMSTESGE